MQNVFINEIIFTSFLFDLFDRLLHGDQLAAGNLDLELM